MVTNRRDRPATRRRESRGLAAAAIGDMPTATAAGTDQTCLRADFAMQRAQAETNDEGEALQPGVTKEIEAVENPDNLCSVHTVCSRYKNGEL
eukprot:6194682-Pleurochrysis_carterae.AAC.2